MQVKIAEYFEIRIYIGCRRGYNGTLFTDHDLKLAISKFQINWNIQHDWTSALRITPTEFVCMDYQEKGWEIAAINYPRFPKNLGEVLDFMRQLTRTLMETFDQNRMTLIAQSNVFHDGAICEMLEKHSAEETHK